MKTQSYFHAFGVLLLMATLFGISHPSSAQIYSSISQTQEDILASNPFGIGTVNQRLLRVDIVTGVGAASTVTNFNITLSGTNITNDVARVSIFGTCNAAGTGYFSDTNLDDCLGYVDNPGSAALDVAVSHTFVSVATIKFYVLVDIKPTATIGNTIDVLCNNVTITGGNPGTETPGAPGVNRNAVVSANISGTKTIKAAAGDYTTLLAAIKDLNNKGLGGAVTLVMDDGGTFGGWVNGDYQYTNFLRQSPTVANPLLITKSGVGAKPILTGAGTGSAKDVLLGFLGVDYVTVDGLSVIATGATEFEYGIIFQGVKSDGCSHNEIRNCSVTMNAQGTFNANSAVRFKQSDAVTASASASNNLNLIHDNAISMTECAVEFNARTQTVPLVNDEGNEIYNNTVTGIFGTEDGVIAIRYCKDSKIYNNVMDGIGYHNDYNKVSRGIHAYQTSCTGYIYCYNNIIRNFTNINAGTQAGVFGISLLAEQVYIYNNMIANIKAGPVAATNKNTIGINLDSNTALNPYFYVWNNSVYLTQDNTASTGYRTVAFSVSGDQSIQVNLRNNIFVNASTGSYNHVVYAKNLPETVIDAASDNNLYWPEATGFITYWESGGSGLEVFNSYNTIDEYTVGMISQGNGGDQNAVSGYTTPSFFNSASDLHINATETIIEGEGLPITAPFALTTDIDGDPRHATMPDLGCDESPLLSPFKRAWMNTSIASLTDFRYTLGSGPSAEQSFSVTGGYLVADATITCTNYELSLVSGGPYSASVTVPKVGEDIAATTIYARLKSGLAEGPATENVLVRSPDAKRKTVSSAGRVYNAIWEGGVSTDWSVGTNWTGRTVPPADASISFDASPFRHCSLDADRSVTDITNAQSTYDLLCNGHKLTVKGDLNFSNGAQIDATAASSVVEFAGAAAQSIPSGAFVSDNVIDMTINNANHVTLNGNLNLLHGLTTTDGRLDAYSGTTPTITYAGTSAQTIGNEFLDDKIYNLTIDNAAGVTVSPTEAMNVTNALTINAGKKLTIPVNKLLKVDGSVSNNAGTSGLLIQSKSTLLSTDANGSFIFPQSSTVQASVEFFCKASWDGGPYGVNPITKYYWQFFGIPISTMTAVDNFYGTYIRQHNEAGWGAGTSDFPVVRRWLQKSTYSTLTPFTGYEITQPAPIKYTYRGQLVNSDFNTTLTYTPKVVNIQGEYPGQHIFGNPYTSAIDITQLTFGADVEKTVYLYNTGSYQDWDTNGDGTVQGVLAGQYVAIPQDVLIDTEPLGLPRQIPSMQGFLVRTLNPVGDFSFGIDYSTVGTRNVEIQRMKGQNAEPKPEIASYTRIDVKGKVYSDQMWLFTVPTTTRGFDNGWDGRKMLGSSVAPQLYAKQSDGNYQVNTVSDIDDTDIDFKPGVDSTYTMTFTHTDLTSSYGTLYLVDLQKNRIVDIAPNGSQYTFDAIPSSAVDTRFKIIRNTDLTTNVEENKIVGTDLCVFTNDGKVFIDNKNSISGEFKIYDVMGRALFADKISPNTIHSFATQLVPGTYVVKAQVGLTSITKQIVIR